MPLQDLFRSRASAAESTRKALVERQLVSLQKNLPMATHRDAERRHWEVGIQLHSMQVLVLQILLPTDFPNTPPTIQLTTPCIHPWLAQDGKTIVGHPQLAQWQTHFDLGRIALEVISMMETTPPTPLLEQRAGRSSGGSAAPARVEQAAPAAGHPRHERDLHQHQQQAQQPQHPEAGRHVQPEPKRTHAVEVPAVFHAIESASIDGLLFMNGDTPDSKTSRELFIQVRASFWQIVSQCSMMPACLLASCPSVLPSVRPTRLFFPALGGAVIFGASGRVFIFRRRLLDDVRDLLVHLTEA